MKYKNNSDDIDQVFDLMLKQSLEDYAEEEGQKLLELLKSVNEKEEPNYSQSFKENIDGLMHQKVKYLPKFRRKSKLKFVVVCLILILFISVYVNANKLKFISTLFHSEADHINIIHNVSSITYPEIEIPDNWEILYLPEKLPVGYTFDEIHFFENFVTIKYLSSDKSNLIFTQFKDLDNIYSLDSENSNMEEITIHTNKGYIIEDREKYILLWNNDMRSFSLKGDCSKDELIEIVKSLKIFSK